MVSEHNQSIYTFLENEIKRLEMIKRYNDNYLFFDLNFYEAEKNNLAAKLKEYEDKYLDNQINKPTHLHKNLSNFFNKSFGVQVDPE